MPRKNFDTTSDWQNWLKTAPVQEVLVEYTPNELLQQMTPEDLILMTENKALIHYLAEELLPQSEDDALREGRMERVEVPIYALIGRRGQRNVNAIADLEGNPVRTRKGEEKGKFKATEEFELLGILSEYLHDTSDVVMLVTVMNEIVDVSWNFLKLKRIGLNHGILESYQRGFALVLGYTEEQYLAFTIAKYHGRTFKGGKDIARENEWLAAVLSAFGEPTKDRLNNYSDLADHLLGKVLVAIRDSIEAEYEGQKMQEALGLMVQAAAHDPSPEE